MAALEVRYVYPSEALEFYDKEWLRKQVAELNARTGFVPVPGATAEMSQRMSAETSWARGIDPDTIVYQQDTSDEYQQVTPDENPE